MLSSEKMQWFAMRATYRRGMQIKALLDKEGINNFIPMRYEVRIRNGLWGIERSGFFNGREKWAKGFENQRV